MLASPSQLKSSAARASQCRRWVAIFILGCISLNLQAATQPKFDLATIDSLLNLAKPGDTSVRVGDMLFKVDDLLRDRARLQPSGAGKAPRSSIQIGVTTWPNGRVPYIFDSGVSSSQKNAFLAACHDWESVASVKFVPADQFDNNFLVVYNAPDNSSYVGMIGGGQPVDIYNWNYEFIICHELAHALGVSHEQSRSDRDTYVTIHSENIQSGQAHNFAKLSTTNTTPYDFDSIMHYGARDFSKNGAAVITANPAYATQGAGMGQRSHLSAYDVQGMAELYGTGAPTLAVNYVGHTIHDGNGGGTGNADAVPNPGESIALGVEVVNPGREPVTGITAILSTTDPNVTITNSTISLPNLDSSAPQTGGNFAFNISRAATNREVIPFKMTITSNQGRVDRSFPVTVAAPGNVLSDVQLVDAEIDDHTTGTRSGNGNALPEAGETVGIVVTLKNGSYGEETNVRLHATESSSWATLTVSDLKFSTLASGVSSVRNGLEVKISPNVPNGTSIPIDLIVTSDQATRTLTTTLTVPLPVVEVPVISPPGGSFNNPLAVTLTSATPGAAIHYTVDDTAPTSSSPLYINPFTVSGFTIVRAIGTKNGYADSDVGFAFFSIRTPSVGFNETFNFSDDQIPPGWQIDVPSDHASLASIANGRFEAQPSDTRASLQRDKKVSDDAIGILAEYRGNIANNAGGMGGEVHLLMLNGDDYFVSLGKPGNSVEAIAAAAGLGSSPTWQQSFAPTYGIYRISAEFHDGEIVFSALKDGSSTELFRNTVALPALDIHQVKTMRFTTFTSSGDSAWLDDIRMTELFVPVPVVDPPKAPVTPQKPASLKAAKVISAGGKTLITVTFADLDQEATEFQIESRSTSPAGKWSTWKTVKRLPANGSTSYSIPLRLKKAGSIQIRVTGLNRSGKSVSKSLTIKSKSAL